MPNEQVLFVDLENVQKLDLAAVPANSRVMIFYGITQKNLPEDLVVQAQPLGGRLKWIKISGQGPNALDFHIAFYLGQQLTRNAGSECVILSRDTGFDPLVRHLASLGHQGRDETLLGRLLGHAHAGADLAPGRARAPGLVHEVTDQGVGLLTELGRHCDRVRQVVQRRAAGTLCVGRPIVNAASRQRSRNLLRQYAADRLQHGLLGHLEVRTRVCPRDTHAQNDKNRVDVPLVRALDKPENERRCDAGDGHGQRRMQHPKSEPLAG